MDWYPVYLAAREGHLLELLVELPRARWSERHECGNSFLHYACTGPNVAAVRTLLVSGLVDVNARNKDGLTPADFAAGDAQPRALEVLCAAGADLRASNADGYSPVDFALQTAEDDHDACVRVLVANGVRLRTVREDYRHLITPAVRAFERGVRRCRAAVVAMLRRRVRQRILWDKDLLVRVAVAVWSTRCALEWTEPYIDWVAVADASKEGRLMEWLAKLPRAHWAERDEHDRSFLHYACECADVTAVVALLASRLLDGNALVSAAEVALGPPCQPGMLWVLCAAGAAVGVAELSTAMQLMRDLHEGAVECVAVLLANGVRLRWLPEEMVEDVQPWMMALERGRLQCRAVVVALLGLKRRRGPVLLALDRWVVKLLGWALWATRADAAWQVPPTIGGDIVLASRWPLHPSTSAPLQWDALHRAAVADQLLSHLRDHVPRARWGERDSAGSGLLHLACSAGDVAAVCALLRVGFAVHDRGRFGHQPLHDAAMNGHARVVELLCAAGARVDALAAGMTPLDLVLWQLPALGRRAAWDCASALLANGASLRGIQAECEHHVSPWMQLLEAGRHRCRIAALVVLGVAMKRMHGISAVGVAVWATRMQLQWQRRCVKIM